jgi:RHS repeat-associated protein
MSNVAQQMVAKRDYDAFGNIISSTGTWDSAFGYAGGFGYQEDATGLKLLGHRYYDSSTGRSFSPATRTGASSPAWCRNDSQLAAANRLAPNRPYLHLKKHPNR